MPKRKNKVCKHIKKENLSSHSGYGCNYVEVKCLDCGMHRHESRYTDTKRIDTSEWFIPKNN